MNTDPDVKYGVGSASDFQQKPLPAHQHNASDLPQNAPINSPALTGNPTAPTVANTDNSTTIATTAFVHDVILNTTITPDLTGYAPLESPVFTGTPEAPTATSGTSNTQLATTAFVTNALSSINIPNIPSSVMTFEGEWSSTSGYSLGNVVIYNNQLYIAIEATQAGDSPPNDVESGWRLITMDDGIAPLASPQFTGVPTVPTGITGSADNTIANTAFVATAITNANNAQDTVNNGKFAPINSPQLTGTPTAPTQSTGDNSNRLATTGFVKSQNYAPLSSPAFTGTPTVPNISAGNLAINTTQPLNFASLMNVFQLSNTINRSNSTPFIDLVTLFNSGALSRLTVSLPSGVTKSFSDLFSSFQFRLSCLAPTPNDWNDGVVGYRPIGDSPIRIQMRIVLKDTFVGGGIITFSPNEVLATLNNTSGDPTQSTLVRWNIAATLIGGQFWKDGSSTNMTSGVQASPVPVFFVTQGSSSFSSDTGIIVMSFNTTVDPTTGLDTFSNTPLNIANQYECAVWI